MQVPGDSREGLLWAALPGQEQGVPVDQPQKSPARAVGAWQQDGDGCQSQILHQATEDSAACDQVRSGVRMILFE